MFSFFTYLIIHKFQKTTWIQISLLNWMNFFWYFRKQYEFKISSLIWMILFWCSKYTYLSIRIVATVAASWSAKVTASAHFVKKNPRRLNYNDFSSRSPVTDLYINCNPFHWRTYNDPFHWRTHNIFLHWFLVLFYRPISCGAYITNFTHVLNILFHIIQCCFPESWQG